MNIILLPRQTGKTQRLIKLAAERGGTIIAHSQNAANSIKRRARDMGLRVHAISVLALQNGELAGHDIREIYMDDLDIILWNLLSRHTGISPIHTVTINSEETDRPRKKKKLRHPKHRLIRLK